MQFYIWEKDREQKQAERLLKIFALTGMMFFTSKVVPDFEILKCLN